MFSKTLKLHSVAFLLIVFFLVSLSYAGDQSNKMQGTADNLKAVEQAFKKDFPNTQIRDVRATDMADLYEITAQSNVFYYYPKTNRLFFGDIVTKDFKNLTAERRHEAEASWGKVLSERIKELPLDKAIKLGNGKKHTVIEFSDIDCPYCRKVEPLFKHRDNVTRYVFLFPLENIHPKASRKASMVLCSKNRATAYDEAMAGKLDTGELKPCDDNSKTAALLTEYRQAALKMEVKGTPAIWIDGQMIGGADMARIESLLSDKQK